MKGKTAKKTDKKAADKSTEKESSTKEKRSGRAARVFSSLKFYITVVLILLVFGGIYYAWNSLTSRKIERLHTSLYNQVQKVAELTVVKDRYCDVTCIRTQNNSNPDSSFGRASAIVKYSGILRIGIPDITKIELSVSPNGKKVEVFVPHSQVLDNTLESQEVYDERTFLWKRIQTQEIFDGIAAEMENTKNRLTDGGILEEADAQTESVIRGMLEACGFTEVIYRWK